MDTYYKRIAKCLDDRGLPWLFIEIYITVDAGGWINPIHVAVMGYESERRVLSRHDQYDNAKDEQLSTEILREVGEFDFTGITFSSELSECVDFCRRSMNFRHVEVIQRYNNPCFDLTMRDGDKVVFANCDSGHVRWINEEEFVVEERKTGTRRGPYTLHSFTEEMKMSYLGSGAPFKVVHKE